MLCVSFLAVGARLHITGDDDVRTLVYSDGTTELATLTGGDGFINSSQPINAPNFVTSTGADLKAMQEVVANLSAIVAAQSATRRPKPRPDIRMPQS